MADADDVTELLHSMTLSGLHDGGSSSVLQESGNDAWRRSIYVKVLCIDKPVGLQTLENTLLSIWSRFEISSVSHIQKGVVMVEFSNPDSIQLIIDEGPWNFQKDFLLIERIIPNLPFHCYKFDTITFWIQLHNIPINLLSTDMICILLDGMGIISPIDPYAHLAWKHFARVQITVKTDFKIRDMARAHLSTGAPVVAILKYERLHRFCVICCALGHEAITCLARRKIEDALRHCTSSEL